ncbi:MAG: ArsR/SmtB family transcription factor [Gammaproteobacteria bacterium]
MDVPPIASICALIGDPARALMLSALMDGRARTATELAAEAGITRQTTSMHLARLTHGGLLAMRSQGRHRYFQLRTPEIAAALETLMVVGEQRARPMPPRSSPEREARTCYDHLAGRLGVALFDALGAGGHLQVGASQLALTPSGEQLFDRLGIDLDVVRQRRRMFATFCLDWSERRHHLGGALGAALLDRFLERGWLRRRPDSRAVLLTTAGKAGLKRSFGVSL